MVRLLDGSMSAQLKQFGYDCNDDKYKPHWSFPANGDSIIMEKVYKSFLDIGVNYITTNTYHFGSTLDKNLPGNDSKKECYSQYFEEACGILETAVKPYHDVQIWGSVGTLATLYHDCSEYTGSYIDFENATTTAHDYYETILTMFQTKTKIRNLIFETISSALEGRIALQVLKKFPEMKAVVSFTFKENGCLRHGEPIHEIAEELKQCSQILGIGINCTDPENVLPVLLELKKFDFQEIFVYPNMGDSKFLTEGSDDSDVFSQEMVSDWVENGTTAIGGCCGVTEKQMRLLKKLIDKINSP